MAHMLITCTAAVIDQKQPMSLSHSRTESSLSPQPKEWKHVLSLEKNLWSSDALLWGTLFTNVYLVPDARVRS